MGDNLYEGSRIGSISNIFKGKQGNPLKNKGQLFHLRSVITVKEAQCFAAFSGFGDNLPNCLSSSGPALQCASSGTPFRILTVNQLTMCIFTTWMF